MPDATLQLRFPLGGLDESRSFSAQPDNTTPYSLNVRPRGSVTNRLRGGSRPATVKRFLQRVVNPQGANAVSYLDDDNTLQRIVVCFGNGEIYVQQGTILTTVNRYVYDESNQIILDEDGNSIEEEYAQIVASKVESVEHLQNVYIADYSVSEPEYDVSVDASGVVTCSDWTNLSAEVNTHQFEIDSTDGPELGVYQIIDAQPTNITIRPIPATAGTCKGRVRVCPKVFDPKTNGLHALIATAGAVPLGAQLVETWRDRIVWAAPQDAQHVWYMSRLDGPTDYDYGADPDDSARAVAATNYDGGSVGERITAIIPHNIETITFGAEHSVWSLFGDPVSGGQLLNLSHIVGIHGPKSWCFIPGGIVVFVAQSGVHVLPPGGRSFPEPYSDTRMPSRFHTLDPDQRIVMGYDYESLGANLFMPSEGWFLDDAGRGFWLQSFPWDVIGIVRYGSREDVRSLMLCSDGYVREFDPAEKKDDGSVTITSRLVLGPYQMSETPGWEGTLREMLATMGSSSDTVLYRVHTGESAEDSVSDAESNYLLPSPKTDGQWRSGANWAHRPYARGQYMSVALRSTGRWEMDSLSATLEPGAPSRFIR